MRQIAILASIDAQGPSAHGQLEKVDRFSFEKEPQRPNMKEDLGSGSFLFLVYSLLAFIPS